MMTPKEIKQVKSHYEVMPMGIAKTEVICLCDTALALWEIVEEAQDIKLRFDLPDEHPLTKALKNLEVK